LLIYIPLTNALLSEESAPIANTVEGLHCDTIIQGPLCYGNGNHVLLPPGIRNNAIAFYNFEESILVDKTGYGHNCSGAISTVSGIHSGNAAMITNKSEQHQCKISKGMIINNLSITFWIFSEGGDHRSKGDCQLLSIGHESNPGRVVAVGVDKTDGKYFVSHGGINYDAYGRLCRDQWSHIGIVLTLTQMTIYLNGIIDRIIPVGLRQADIGNSVAVLKIGDSSKLCTERIRIDDLWLYNRALGDADIIADSSDITGLTPGYIKIACFECESVESIISICQAHNMRICNNIDYGNGVVQLLRANDYPIDNLLTSVNDGDKAYSGIGVCCRE